MGEKNRLDGKKLLLVDDEPDVLDTLEDVLSMCKTTRAGSFQEARDLLESEYFDMAILDIMGVDGYKLLEISNRQKVSAVMLTAQALSPGHVKKSYREGAAFYVPKEEMSRLTLFLEDILEDLEKGKTPGAGGSEGWPPFANEIRPRLAKGGWRLLGKVPVLLKEFYVTAANPGEWPEVPLAYI
jgi:DNA-binding NtrC family response regulator